MNPILNQGQIIDEELGNGQQIMKMKTVGHFWKRLSAIPVRRRYG